MLRLLQLAPFQFERVEGLALHVDTPEGDGGIFRGAVEIDQAEEVPFVVGEECLLPSFVGVIVRQLGCFELVEIVSVGAFDFVDVGAVAVG